MVRQTPLVPFHGKTIGFVINYTPDRAVRFDIRGNPIELLPVAYIPGKVQIEISGRRMSAAELAGIFGGGRQR